MRSKQSVRSDIVQLCFPSLCSSCTALCAWRCSTAVVVVVVVVVDEEQV